MPPVFDPLFWHNLSCQSTLNLQVNPSKSFAGKRLRKMGTICIEDCCANLIAEASSYFDRVISALS
jgi:phycoerythrin beta chain